MVVGREYFPKKAVHVSCVGRGGVARPVVIDLFVGSGFDG